MVYKAIQVSQVVLVTLTIILDNQFWYISDISNIIIIIYFKDNQLSKHNY